MTLAEGFAGPYQAAEGGAVYLQGGCKRLAEVVSLHQHSGLGLDKCHAGSPGSNPTLQDTSSLVKRRLLTSITLQTKGRLMAFVEVFTRPFPLKPSENFFPS